MAKSTVNAALTNTLVFTAQMYGLERDEVLNRASLTEAMLSDPDGRVPFTDHMRVWAQLLALDRPFLGVELGRAFRPDIAGVLGFLMTQAPTVRDATKVAESHGKLVSDIFMPRAFEQGDRAVFGQVLQPAFVKMRHPGEWCMANCLALVEQLTGRKWPVRALQFQHLAPKDTTELVAFFGFQPTFGARSSRIEFDRQVMDAKVVRADPSLFSYLTRHADTLLNRLRPEDSVANLVRRELARAMSEGEPRQDLIAKRLAMSERTLQRRLKDEGASFAELLDEIRRELALLYLGERGLAVYEVSLLLGYAEPSAFFRAFKRWTGKTPQEFRVH